ncbi:MAG: hypothetical protein JW816_00155 [Candidatus Buchananbacteria bacterium]|nr:hypothetical protein [Candidatus Buchananbacteria bacterium]
MTEKNEGQKIEIEQTAEISRLKNLIDECRDVDYEKTYNRCNEFALSLQKKYGREEAGKYQLFHVLLLSSPKDKKPYFDFEGEDSIKDFIENLNQEIVGEQE